MIKLAIGNKEKTVLLTITAILLLALSAYIGERFQPYKITKNIGSYAVKQIATADTHKKAHARASTERHIKYVVKKGDTVWNISKKYKVHPELLKFANHLGNNSKITIGQRLTIPKNS